MQIDFSVVSENLAKTYGDADCIVTVVSMDPPPGEFADVLHFWALLEGASDDNPNVVHDDRKDCLVLRFTGGN